MFRRSLLKAALLGPALLGCESVPERRAELPARTPARWLDVHCHVFNGSDLPIYEFVKRTRLDTNPLGWIAAPIVAFLAGCLHHDAPSAQAELAGLLGPAAPAVAAVMPSQADPLTGLQRLRDRVAYPPRPAPALASPAGGLALPGDDEGLRLFDQAFQETGIRTPPLASAGLPQPSAANVAPPSPPSDHELAAFDARVRSDDVLSRYFRWGLMFAEPRNGLVGRLAGLYPESSELMLTPAMVDYDAWLNAPDTKPADQVQVMREIAIARARDRQAVHAFASFDPWRCLKRRDAIRRGASQADLVDELKADLASGAVIGVKLYPPMGFGAGGNARRDIGKLPFPDALVRLTKGRPGEALDDVLAEVFDHCADNGIPVMAHCGSSNGSRVIYDELAGPEYWRAALDVPGKPRRRELRVNLGHFGGIWDLGDASTGQRDWASAIAGMMRTFPNLHADIAYFGSVLNPDQAEIVRQTVSFIANAADQTGSPLRQRLMYGSDWSMIGQEPSSEGYATAAVRALSPVWPGDEEEDLRWRNAARFLGLAKGDATRSRLAAFYAANQLDRSLLDGFDPAS